MTATAYTSSTQQLALFRRRGGTRRGAGRRPGPNPRVRHRGRAEFRGRFPGHVTLKLASGLSSLRERTMVRALEAALRAACDRGSFRVVVFSIQGDHLHLVVEADDRAALGRGMKAVAARVARAVNRVLQRCGKVLQDRYHLHVLRTPLEVRRALVYVLCNARKHLGARAPRGAWIDPASSGRWFQGWRSSAAGGQKGLHGFGADAVAAAVARPLTWLLRIGWRRHGRIDPSEAPGARGP